VQWTSVSKDSNFSNSFILREKWKTKDINAALIAFCYYSAGGSLAIIFIVHCVKLNHCVAP